MTATIERAKLIPVRGSTVQTARALSVQFNPETLKVALSNTLKPPKGSGGNAAAQFVDKSSSTLTVELIFDTTLEATDVRLKTKEIAERFMKPKPSGNRMQAPDRCRFQWGAFAFVGMMQSYDETLDFFSPEGIPLRATLSLKLSEDRYQFETLQRTAAARATPRLTASGASPETPREDGGGGGAPPGVPEAGQPVTAANAEAGRSPRDWRDTALFNGLESPRFPTAPAIAVPQVSLTGSVSTGAWLSGGVGVSGGLGLSGTAGLSASAQGGFRFGASSALGTNIAGAFSATANLQAGAGSVVGGALSGNAFAQASASTAPGASASAGASAGAGGAAGAGAAGDAGGGTRGRRPCGR